MKVFKEYVNNIAGYKVDKDIIDNVSTYISSFPNSYIPMALYLEECSIKNNYDNVRFELKRLLTKENNFNINKAKNLEICIENYKEVLDKFCEEDSIDLSLYIDDLRNKIFIMNDEYTNLMNLISDQKEYIEDLNN